MKKYFLLLLGFLPLLTYAQWQKRIPPGGPATDLVQIKGQFFTIRGGILYESTNYGQSWHPAGLDKPGYVMEQLRTDADTLYVAGAAGLTAGIFRSTDLGKTWQELPSPYIWLYGHELVAANRGALYYREYATFLELKPGATKWDTIATFVVGDGIKLAFSQEYIFIGTWHGIYRYDRLTQTLEGLNNTPSYDIFFWEGNLLSGTLLSTDLGLTWNSISNFTGMSYIDEEDGVLYGVSGEDIWRSENLFDWSLVAQINSPFNPIKLAVSGKVMIAVASFGQLLRSTDLGEHWTVNNSGLPNTLSSPWFTKNHMPSYLQLDASLSPDGGKSWFAPVVNGGLTGIYVEDKGKVLTVSYQNNSWVILQSDLAMQDWQWVSDMPTPVSGDFFIKTGDKLVYNSNKILVSSDGGATWVEEGTLPAFGDLRYSHKGSLIDAGVNGGLSLSPDFGHTWQDIAPAGSGNYYKVVSAGDNLFAWHDFYLFVSTDFGQSWENLTNLLPSPGIGNWAFTARGDSLFIAKKDTVFFSPNLGQSWVNITSNLSLPSCDALTIFQGELIAMSTNGAVWAMPLSAINRALVDGVVFHDLNNNGVRDIGEEGIENLMVRNSTKDAFAFTDTAGVFHLLTRLAGDSAVVVVPWAYAISTPEAQSAIPGGPELFFGIYFEPGAKDLCIAATATSAFVPGFEAKVILTVKNPGPTTQDASVTLLLDQKVDFLNSNPAPVSVNVNTVQWLIPNLEPFQTVTIEVTCYTPPDVAAGTSLISSMSVGPLDDDANPNNNFDRLNIVVRSSFDPNDKVAHTGDRFTPDQYAAGEPIKYTIRFQNTGNYPAQFVRIVDTLDAQFDITSFALLANSHPVSVSIEGENKLVFFFDMIHLPDSSADEAGSHGFVTYSLKPRPGLPLGSVFRNTAHIFFDYNLPVHTNTVVTTLALPLRVQEAFGRPVLLWPNPTSGELSIRLPSDNDSPDALQIFDLCGRACKTEYLRLENNCARFSIEDLPPGVYFVKCLKNSETVGVAKVVKQ